MIISLLREKFSLLRDNYRVITTSLFRKYVRIKHNLVICIFEFINQVCNMFELNPFIRICFELDSVTKKLSNIASTFGESSNEYQLSNKVSLTSAIIQQDVKNECLRFAKYIYYKTISVLSLQISRNMCHDVFFYISAPAFSAEELLLYPRRQRRRSHANC